MSVLNQSAHYPTYSTMSEICDTHGDSQHHIKAGASTIHHLYLTLPELLTRFTGHLLRLTHLHTVNTLAHTLTHTHTKQSISFGSHTYTQ